jgi:hypothetical protein
VAGCVGVTDLISLLSPDNMWNQSYVDSVFAYENGLEDVVIASVALRLNAG